MKQKFLFRNKKASLSVELSLIHLLEIILALIVIGVLIYLITKLAGFFIGRQEYDSTINNFEQLQIKVNELTKDKNKISTKTMIYSLPNDYILVGFNYDNEVVETACTDEKIDASRPNSCKYKSCLCIYKNYGGVTDWTGKDFDSRGNVKPIVCKSFQEKIIFIVPQQGNPNFKGKQSKYTPSHYTSTSYNSLVLYGVCGLRPSWDTKQLYIEKYNDNDKFFISIGDMSDQAVISRKNYFSDKAST